VERRTNGAKIVEEAYSLITGDRMADYSHPFDDYARTVNIFNAITGHNLSIEDGILFMIAVKLSRLAHEIKSGSNIPDNTRDAIGYLGCLNMVRQAKREVLKQ
jgi:hypothetical protein